MSDDLQDLSKKGPAISGTSADFSFSQTGTTVDTRLRHAQLTSPWQTVADPTSDTPKFNLTPETIDIELSKEFN